jgi:hypothetical protein
MKKSLIALAIAIGCCNVQSAFCIRKDTLRGVFGVGFIAMTAAGYYEFRHQNPAKRMIISALSTALLVAPMYYIASKFTPDHNVDIATKIIDEINYNNPIASQSFNADRDLFFALKSLYFKGDIWLINAKSELTNVQNDLIKALDLIGQAKQGAYGDTTFLAHCDVTVHRGRNMLANISHALRVVDKGIAENAWNGSDTSERTA